MPKQARTENPAFLLKLLPAPQNTFPRTLSKEIVFHCLRNLQQSFITNMLAEKISREIITSDEVVADVTRGIIRNAFKSKKLFISDSICFCYCFIRKDKNWKTQSSKGVSSIEGFISILPCISKETVYEIVMLNSDSVCYVAIQHFHLQGSEDKRLSRGYR